MDQQRDFENFKRLMAKLCQTMDKPVTDVLVESWWKSLRTVQYAEVERRIEAYIARATEKTPFPRPGQMRPDDVPVVADAREEARERRMSEENARNWKSFIADHPRTGPIRLKMALASRIIATEHEDSVAYDEATKEYLHLETMLGQSGRFSADA